MSGLYIMKHGFSYEEFLILKYDSMSLYNYFDSIDTIMVDDLACFTH